MGSKRPKMPKLPKTPAYPSGKAGNYRAPVDTVGMDPEMIKTLGIPRKQSQAASPRKTGRKR